MELIPIVVKKSAQGERSYDIYSFLLRNRIVFLNGVINDNVAASICAQLIFLAAEDSKKDIHLYINSVGGALHAAMAMYDTIQLITPDVQTWGMGLAASCGSLLLTAGTKGKRNILPHTRVMLHEPSSGYQGRSRHMEDHARESAYNRKMLVDIYHKHTQQPKDDIEKWLERETFFSSKESEKLGIIDNIVEHSNMINQVQHEDFI